MGSIPSNVVGRISLKIFTLLLVLAFTTRLTATQPDSSSIIPSLLVFNIQGDTINLTRQYSGRNLYMILYNEYACKNCFASLASALLSIHDHDSSLSIIAILRVGEGVYAKRRALVGARKALPQVQDFYFDCRDISVDDAWPPSNLQGGLFGRYNTSKTPSLLHASNGLVRYLPYEDIAEPLTLSTASDQAASLRKILLTR